ncbi:MAG TPA: ABC transporter permease [Polyangiaceae bacterium]|nr:ABC transporter permease [Polyangiaceae bacterium]
MSFDSPLTWAFLGFIGLLSVALFVRGLRPVAVGLTSKKERQAGPVVVGTLGALFGILFASLLTVALRNPRIPNEPFNRVLEAVRYSSLAAGVVFLGFVLAAGLPLGLDLLERSGFIAFVSARHVRATKSGFLTIISVLSILGVSVSSCALCSVTSVMGGFGHDLRQKILGNNPHVVVDTRGLDGFDQWEAPLAEIRKELGPDGHATPVVSGDAMSQSSTNTAGILLRGIDADTFGDVNDLPLNLEVGKWSYLTDEEALAHIPVGEVIGKLPDGTPKKKLPAVKFYSYDPTIDASVRDAAKEEETALPGVILGREIAKSLHVYVGDEVSLVSPNGELGPAGILPRVKKFRVAAIFYTGVYEYDAAHGFITLPQAQKFFDLGEKITQIDARVSDPEKIESFHPRFERALRSAFDPAHRPDNAPPPPELRVRDWKEMNANLFSALKLERLATFLILSIAIVVASFCILCTLLLMVTEKGKQIAIMKALGASKQKILRIFMAEGVIIGAIGTVFGVALALAACTGLKWFGARLPPEVYYIDRLPVNVDVMEYLRVALAALVICTGSTIYPAWTASRLNPIEGLHHE